MLRTMIRATGLLLLCTIVESGSAQIASPSSPTCSLTEEDKLANAKMSFQDFDQTGTSPATARKLGNRECYREAAQATEDYLLRGPVTDPYPQRVLLFHMGQYLASAGDESVAAHVIAGTKNPTQTAAVELDWNTYVEGTWAFLVKDKKQLDTASAELSAAQGPRNGINARVLRGLQTCFDKSYAEAYSSMACRGP